MSDAHKEAACAASCPVQRSSQVLDGKWTILVLRDLLGGARRYSELQRSLSGISPRLLTLRLRSLETQGIIQRTVFPTNPPSTEYALTALGQAILPVVQAMATWGEALLAQDALEKVPAEEMPAYITRVLQGKKVGPSQA